MGGKVLANVVDNSIQNEVAEELYYELLKAYMGVHGGKSKQVLEYKMEFLMKKGLSRAEAINNILFKHRQNDAKVSSIDSISTKELNENPPEWLEHVMGTDNYENRFL
jgi:hypothetical protein